MCVQRESVRETPSIHNAGLPGHPDSEFERCSI